MTFFRRERHVVPRWRPLAAALQNRELARPQRQVRSAELDPELTARLETWRRAPDLVSASEALETAIVTGNEHEAVRPAQFLVDPDAGATLLVRRQAELLLSRTEGHPKDRGPEFPNLHATRIRTRQFSDDPLAWADLALGYLILGKQDDAERAIRVALQLAPHDRQILRAASRLYLHVGDAERAHDLLKRNEATRRDPWLMAGEIALSSLAGRSPSFLKQGRALIEERAAMPFHLSELASAIGTVNLRDGNRKAKRMFEQSLLDPTGNSLAQAQWANPHIGDIVSSHAADHVPDSSEARSFQAYWAGNFERALKEAEQWVIEEPYSSRPYVAASFAAIVLDKSDAAKEYSEKGLLRDPDSIVLRNHLAYALCDLGFYKEAAGVIRSALSKPSNDHFLGLLMATAGMVLIRQGMIERGEEFYRDAIDFFRRQGNQSYEALATAYLAREMCRANAKNADALLSEAERLCKNLRFLPEAGIVIKKARYWRAAVHQREELAASGVNPANSSAD